jgi:hypothetical protein
MLNDIVYIQKKAVMFMALNKLEKVNIYTKGTHWGEEVCIWDFGGRARRKETTRKI